MFRRVVLKQVVVQAKVWLPVDVPDAVLVDNVRRVAGEMQEKHWSADYQMAMPEVEVALIVDDGE